MRQDTILRATSNDGLSLDEMRRRLPSIFAEQPHESRSERYVYVSTTEVIEALDREGFKPFEARMSRSRSIAKQSFAKHMIRFRSTAAALARKVKGLSFEVILKNAHDGSAAYDFLAGLFSFVCMNGLVVGDASIASIHVRHAGNKQAILDQVVDGANAVLKTAPLALEAPEKWSGIDLSRDEQHAFADSARVLRFGDAEGNVHSPITSEQLLIPRRTEDVGSDLWKTFQRVQENTVRGGLSAMGRMANGRQRQSTTREIRAIDGDVKLNKGLWLLADSMAKIKTGEKPAPAVIDAEFAPVN